MKSKNKNEQQGSVLVVIIMFVVVAIVGTASYLYWNNFLVSDDNQYQIESSTNKKTEGNDEIPKAEEPEESPNKGYFVIKEWGVRAPYHGKDTFSYTIKGPLATIISKQLAEKYEGCATYGAGQIVRLLPTNGAYADGTGPEVEQVAKENPHLYTRVGGYYYRFLHDSAVCNFKEGTVVEQNQANSVIKALVAKLEQY